MNKVFAFALVSLLSGSAFAATQPNVSAAFCMINGASKKIEMQKMGDGSYEAKITNDITVQYVVRPEYRPVTSHALSIKDATLSVVDKQVSCEYSYGCPQGVKITGSIDTSLHIGFDSQNQTADCEVHETL